MNRVTAVILAGGLGTRLRLVVADRPKVLAEIHGRPWIAYLLEELNHYGVSEVILCTGYLGEQVKQTLGEYYDTVHISYSQEHQPLGTAGAVRHALTLITSDLVLVMNGDSFCQTDLNDLYAKHLQRDAIGTLVLTYVPDTQRYGQVCLDGEGRVLQFIEKARGEGSGWINAGVYLLDRRVVESIPAGIFTSFEKQIFPDWVGGNIYGYLSTGLFLDIGTPESYALAKSLFPPQR